MRYPSNLKRSCWLLLLVLLAALSPAGAELRVGAEHGLLWQVSKPGLQASYLLGTIHMEDERVMAVMKPVRQPLRDSASFSAEIKFDTMAMLYAATAMRLPAGGTLEQQVGKPLYRQAVAAMGKRGIPENIVAVMKPWAVAMTLSMPPMKTGQVLDTVLYAQAVDQGKRVYGLETIREQMAIFDELSAKEQTLYLQETLDQLDEIPVVLEQMVQLYLKRDLAGLKTLSERPIGDTGSQFFARRFMKILLDDRNKRFVERMQGRLHEGRAFIAVGALHLPGEHGVLRLLERAGYVVEPVY